MTVAWNQYPHFLKAPDPQGDLAKGGTRIFLGKCYAPISSEWYKLQFEILREACIERNFTTNDAEVSSIYGRQRDVQEIKISSLQCLRENLGFGSDVTWKSLAYKMMIMTTCLVIFVCLGVNYIKAYQNAILTKNFIRVLSFSIGTIFMMTTAAKTVYGKLKTGLKNPFTDKRVVIQPIKLSPSSMTGVDLKSLNNRVNGDQIEDPITFDDYSAQEIRSPRILRVGIYAVEIITAIRAMLSKIPENNGHLPHPVENRQLSVAEETKVVADICAFFSIHPEELLNCWDNDLIPEILEAVPNFYDLEAVQQIAIRKEFDQEIRLPRQNRKFINLLTSHIAQKYFSGLNTEEKEFTRPEPVVRIALDPMAFFQLFVAFAPNGGNH